MPSARSHALPRRVPSSFVAASRRKRFGTRGTKSAISSSADMRGSRAATPTIKDLVLVGGGHAHVYVLKSLAMTPMPGVRVTLIAKDLHTPYSGMLPGAVAGHYEDDETRVDLEPLCRNGGFRIVHDEAIGIDHDDGRVIVKSGRPGVRFDVASVDVGIAPRAGRRARRGGVRDAGEADMWV